MIKKISNQMYVLKAISIFSVICAHMRMVNYSYENELIDRLYASVGTIGVICFLFMSGLFLNVNEKKNIFWKKKIKNIIIPWIFCSLLTYILSVIITKKFSIVEYIKWVVGAGSWYYFVTIILILYLTYRIVQNEKIIYLLLIIGILSNIMTIRGQITYNEWFTPYLNVFNWVPFFSLGVICNKKQFINKIQQFINKNIIFIIFLFCALLLVQIFGKEDISYWSSLSLPFEFIGLLLGIFLADKMKDIPIMISIGKHSFTIYLIHMQIAGIINTRIPNSFIFELNKSLIALMITYFIILIIKDILYKCKQEKILFLIGLR